MKMELYLEMETKSELNMREHWAQRNRRFKAQKEQVCWEFLRSKHGPPDLPVTVLFVRCAPRSLDKGDNLNSAFKAIRDQVAKQLGVDDADPRVSWDYDQEKAKTPAIKIKITPREDA